MALRGAKKRRAADRGFVLSDHADWDGLIQAIEATNCETVYLTHGYTASFSRYLADIGYDAHEAHTLYGGDEANEQDENPVELVDEEGKVIEPEDNEAVNAGDKVVLTDLEKSIALKKAKKAGGAV